MRDKYKELQRHLWGAGCKISELEKRIKELEETSEKLDENLSDIEGAWSALLVKFGDRIRKTIWDEVDSDIDNIEYRMLKKLVDGNMFELKMKEKKAKKE